MTEISLNEKIAIELGSMIVQFSRLELLVSQFILYLEGTYRPDDPEGSSLHNLTPFSRRLESLECLLNNEDLPADLTRAFNDILSSMTEFNHRRNDLVHGICVSNNGNFQGVQRIVDGELTLLRQSAESIHELVQDISGYSQTMRQLISDNRLSTYMDAHGMYSLPRQEDSVQMISERLLREMYG